MEYRKTKRIVELSSFEKHTRHGSMSSAESGKRKLEKNIDGGTSKRSRKLKKD